MMPPQPKPPQPWEDAPGLRATPPPPPAFADSRQFSPAAVAPVPMPSGSTVVTATMMPHHVDLVTRPAHAQLALPPDQPPHATPTAPLMQPPASHTPHAAVDTQPTSPRPPMAASQPTVLDAEPQPPPPPALPASGNTSLTATSSSCTTAASSCPPPSNESSRSTTT
nr:neural Wiskott-Aldrich syndrome protein-like [Taeniopygia guttata]